MIITRGADLPGSPFEQLEHPPDVAKTRGHIGELQGSWEHLSVC